jgi:hypothetical protein
MTKAELIAALTNVPDDAKIVIDVDADQCHSDRNVLEVLETRYEEAVDDTKWVFLQAGSDA